MVAHVTMSNGKAYWVMGMIKKAVIRRYNIFVRPLHFSLYNERPSKALQDPSMGAMDSGRRSLFRSLDWLLVFIWLVFCVNGYGRICFEQNDTWLGMTGRGGADVFKIVFNLLGGFWWQ